MTGPPDVTPTPVGSGDPSDRLRAVIRTVRDFPTAGVVFRDITPLLADGSAFRTAVDGLVETFKGERIDVVAGVESRGFVFGGAVAYVLGAGFVPVRKQGRLPRRTLSVAYQLEYGEAVLEIHADAIEPGQHVLIVDDVLATGGTAAATIRLVEQLGGMVAGIAFLVELAELGGAARLHGHPHTSLITL